MLRIISVFLLKSHTLEVNAVLSRSAWLYNVDTNLYFFIHGLSPPLSYYHVYRETS